MASEDNKNLMRNFLDEVWNDQNLDYIDECLADNYVEHTTLGDFTGPDELRGFVSMTTRSFPDFSVTIQEVISEGNFVACYYTTNGTHQEEYLGVEPTGNEISLDGCVMARIENGKMVEAWNQFDAMTMLMGMEVLSPDMLGGMEQMGTGRMGGSRA